MTSPTGPSPSDAQTDRCRRFSVDASVDIHCHCLAGVDDGPNTPADSLALCKALVSDGITDVIATPHRLGSYEEAHNRAADVRRAVIGLRQSLAEADVPLRVHAGSDVRVDDRLIPLLDADEILTLGDTRAFILLELPHDAVIDLSRLNGDLHARGITAILSHPERHEPLMRQPDFIDRWTAEGLLLQVTAGSLLGQFGPLAESASWKLVDSGLAAIIAGYAHGAVHRNPSMTAALAAIAARKGHAIARRICLQNPLSVLQGDRAAFKTKTVRPKLLAKPRRWWERAS